ncbi:hypothetical protein ACFL58_00580 [Elusimicrobiota bacterium]
MHKKTLFFFLIISLIFISQFSYAAVTSVSKSTSTAVASLTGTGNVSMSIELLNLTGGSTTQIYWNTAGIDLGTTTWRRSDSYILLHATFTSATGGVQIYTDNKDGAADPQYVGVSTAAGLVCVSSPTANPLPTCWRIVATSTDTLTIEETGVSSLYSTEIGAGYLCFLFMKDVSVPGNFSDGDDDVTVVDWARGIHHSEGEWGQESTPFYIYIGANFNGAEAGKVYKCSTLLIEAFTE